MKIAVVQKGLEDDDLSHHLLMHASRLSTYPLVCEELRSIFMARDTLTGPRHADRPGLGGHRRHSQGQGQRQGKKGKGRNKSKGNGKEKDKEKDPRTNPDAEMICYYCHRKGHRKRDCRVFDRDKKCVNAVEQAPGLMLGAASASSVTPSGVSMIELDDSILAVSFDEHEEVVGSVERVMVDSGAAVSVCPFGCALEIPMSDHSRRATLRTASGAQIEHAGQKMVEFEHDDGGSVNINFEVADVTRPLVAVGQLQRRGMTVVMGPHGSFVTRGQVMQPPGSNLDLEHSNGAYWMRLTRAANGTRTIAPIDLGNAVPTSKDLSELPSVEDTVDVAREDTEANVPTAVATPKEPGAVERSRNELTHMPYGSWCFSCVAGRGADDPTESLTATADHQEWSVTSWSCRVACISRIPS